jgi:hypothetical protein
VKTFDHVNARSVDEALSLLRDYGGRACVIAGGTDLLGVLKDQILEKYPEALINIKTIPGLDTIEEEAEGLRIGALAKVAEIVRSPCFATAKGPARAMRSRATIVTTPSWAARPVSLSALQIQQLPFQPYRRNSGSWGQKGRGRFRCKIFSHLWGIGWIKMNL